MNPIASLPRPLQLVLWVALVLLGLAVALPWFVTPLIAARIRALAHARGLESDWDQLRFAWPLTVELRGLELRRSGEAPPVVSAERVEVSLGPRGLSLRPGISRLVLDHGRVILPEGGDDVDSTLVRE